MKIVVFVGMPGAGKSTKAKEYEDQCYIIHSPDAIRNEYNMHEIDQVSEILEILYERMFRDMKAGKNIVFDSTNISRRGRIKFLNKIKEFDYEKECLVFLVPIDVCKERNSKRVGFSRVSENEYNSMLSVFSIPTTDEGWDQITLNIQDPNVKILEGGSYVQN